VDITVVLDADLHAIANTLLDRSTSGMIGLFLRQRDADRLNAIVASSVADKGSPATTDIEDTHTALETELAGNKIVLRLLSLLQAGRCTRNGTRRRFLRLRIGRGLGPGH
jgi:hypothetical protein